MKSLTTAQRLHPQQVEWVTAESRMRASYVATRAALVEFLVAHRFEGGTKAITSELNRANLGYGIHLNRAYLREIMGHIRGTSISYAWGPLASGKEVEEDGTTPTDGVARTIAKDATRKGVPLRDFIEGEVLEWMLSSPGGIVVVDISGAEAKTKADEAALGKRPFFKFVPWGAIEDVGLGPVGFRWIKFLETVDNRDMDGEDEGETNVHVLYWLDTSGDTWAGRYNDDGACVHPDGSLGASPRNLLKFQNSEGTAILPLEVVGYGTHPDIPFVGTGLLHGLDDIVIDLYNVLSEMREGFRDATFALTIHKGPDQAAVNDAIKMGSRLVHLGEAPGADLQRVAGDSGEVATGITLVELGVRNWALSAKRQAAEAMGPSGGAANKSSGVALGAEFQLDLKPLLVDVCKLLDTIETNLLALAAQMMGLANAADAVRVTRKTDFTLEDEAARIARITKEYILALPLAGEAKVQLAMKWIEASKTIDLTEIVETPGTPATPGTLGPDGEPLTAAVPGTPGASETVREKIERETRALVEQETASAAAMAMGPGLVPSSGGVAAFGGPADAAAPPMPAPDAAIAPQRPAPTPKAKAA